MNVMKTRIKLSPYDPKKRLRLIIEGAKTVGTGFVLCQYVNEANPSQRVNIIHTGARKFEPGKICSPVEAEAIALKRAISECHYWIYYSDPIMLFSDCSGLLDMMEKPLADIENGKRKRRITTGRLNTSQERKMKFAMHSQGYAPRYVSMDIIMIYQGQEY